MAFDIGEMFRRIFTPPGTGGLEAQNQMAASVARNQANVAMQAQRDAVAEIAKASVPALDSEDARVASEDRIRKLLTTGTFMQNFSSSPVGPQPLNYQQLFGAQS